MNALVGSIRARVSHGYHMTHYGQAIEDVKALLELVDKLVQSHWSCIRDKLTDDCVVDIAEELGVVNSELTALPYLCVRCNHLQREPLTCLRCGSNAVIVNEAYLKESHARYPEA